jgi:hypothetical protein
MQQHTETETLPASPLQHILKEKLILLEQFEKYRGKNFTNEWIGESTTEKISTLMIMCSHSAIGKTEKSNIIAQLRRWNRLRKKWRQNNINFSSQLLNRFQRKEEIKKAELSILLK